jgi:tRNA(Ile2) C34 agmatinyltransferase TiaS
MGAVKEYLMEQAQQDADDQATCEDCGAEMDFIVADGDHYYCCLECQDREREHQEATDPPLDAGELAEEIYTKLKRK